MKLLMYNKIGDNMNNKQLTINNYNNKVFNMIEDKLEYIKLLYQKIDNNFNILENDETKKLIDKEEKEYLELYNLIIK